MTASITTSMLVLFQIGNNSHFLTNPLETMGFNKLYQFGITFEPNFLQRTDNYDIHEWRQIKQDYVDKMNHFKDQINESQSIPSTPSTVIEKSFISSNNDSIILPDVTPIQNQSQFHSIQVQTSFLMDHHIKGEPPLEDEDDIQLHADVSILVQKEADLIKSKDASLQLSDIHLSAQEESIVPDIAMPNIIPPIASSIPVSPMNSDININILSDEPCLHNSFSSPVLPRPFQSAILNRIATKVESNTPVSTQSISTPSTPLRSSSPASDDNFTNSLKSYLQELKDLMSLNQELMNKPLDIVPIHHMPKIVEYSTSDLDDDLTATPKAFKTPKRRSRPIKQILEPIDAPQSRTLSRKRKQRTPEPSLKKQKIVVKEEIEPLVEDIRIPTPPRSQVKPLILSTNTPSVVKLKTPIRLAEKIEDIQEHHNILSDEMEELVPVPQFDQTFDEQMDHEAEEQVAITIPDIQEYNEDTIEPISQQPTPKLKKKTPKSNKSTVKRKIAPKAASTSNNNTDTRKRRKHLRKSFIDNEWVDTDTVSNKQMNVVEQVENGEYIVIEEIEKTIHGVKRDKHAKITKKSTKKVPESLELPFKIAPSICKKPTAKQVKDAIQGSIDIFMDLKEEENVHVGYIGLTKGTELKGTEIGNAVYIVSSGQSSVKIQESNEEIVKGKDVFVVNKDQAFAITCRSAVCILQVRISYD